MYKANSRSFLMTDCRCATSMASKFAFSAHVVATCCLAPNSFLAHISIVLNCAEGTVVNFLAVII